MHHISFSKEYSTMDSECEEWRYLKFPNKAITFNNWEANEGCEGDTCARMQGNGIK